MATKLCIICNKRRARLNDGINDMCTPCYEYAGWENTHSDDDHEGVLAGDLVWGMTTHKTRAEFNAYVKHLFAEIRECPVCQGNDPADAPVRTGHTNTVAKSRTSHREHYHARTPEARAACRKLTRAGNAPLDTRTKK